MYVFKFADIGEGLHEGTVGEISVKVGQKVKEGDTLFSVETDKVASEIPCPVDGIIKEIKMSEGDVIHVGQDIFVIDDGSGDSVPASEPIKNEDLKTSSSSTTSFYVFKFADIGEGLHEGTVGEISVKVGQEVKEGDTLFSVETDKVASEIPCPVDGIIKEIKMSEGDVIHVGQDIFVIDAGDKNPTSSEANISQPNEGAEEEEKCLVGDAPNSSELINLDFLSPSQPDNNVEVKETKEICSQESTCENDGVSFTEDGKSYSGNIDEEFDVIVVGSGPGGYLAAEEAGKSGLKTMIVEKKYWGGVCLNTGCIPTKALLKTTEVIKDMKHAEKYGIIANSIKINEDKTWKAMHARKAEVVKKISKSVEMLMKGSKVTSVFGEAEFVAARTIKVNDKVYSAKNMIIATGSTANQLRMIPGFDKGYDEGTIITSEEAINYDKKLPKKVTIIGGGVIGLEFATVFAHGGAKVTVIQNTERLLPFNEKEVSTEADKILKSLDATILYNANTKKYEDGKLYVEVDGKEQILEQDIILTATGRTAHSKGLAEIGVKLGERGVVLVDSHQRTNVKGMYAIGDVTGQNMLAHVAYGHALAAVFHILGDKEKGTYHPAGIPGCIYTDPEISFIGLTEEEAKKAGKNVFASKYSFEYLGKSIATTHTEGFIKLIVDKEYGEILGASIVGPHSTDYIAEIALAMEQEVTVHELAHTIHPHPTYNEIIWEAARSASLKLSNEARKK
ncbi:dihydrolipoyl dehydrogenase [Mycoplasmopsis lipofaciens]|uniref:dihydrolipoyl dehydrogenase n=1 Tax=Mycoplasmopsis lipofaciens TaxID=114884 RepID=UPI00055A8D55|nr:dihydrolipoyl dehydrogenase [Mycoplasmopsis lipofaciens]